MKEGVARPATGRVFPACLGGVAVNHCGSSAVRARQFPVADHNTELVLQHAVPPAQPGGPRLLPHPGRHRSPGHTNRCQVAFEVLSTTNYFNIALRYFPSRPELSNVDWVSSYTAQVFLAIFITFSLCSSSIDRSFFFVHKS